MEEQYYLTPNAIETKCIQRLLTPITSHISLLVIHLQYAKDVSSNASSSDFNTHSDPDIITLAAKKVINSVSDFIRSSPPARLQFLDDDALRLSSNQLLESTNDLNLSCKTMRCKRDAVSADMTVAAAKSVLQAALKVLLVLDGTQVAEIRSACHSVKEKLGLLLSVQNMVDLAPILKVFLCSVKTLSMLSVGRQRDLISDTRRSLVITSLITMKKAVPLLIAALINGLKYSENQQAFVTCDFAVNEIKTSLDSLLNAFTDRTPASDIDDTFSRNITKTVSYLKGDIHSRDTADLEVWLGAIIKHAMFVAHLCQDERRDVIVKTSQRILHQKIRVTELERYHRDNKELPQLRMDLDAASATLQEETLSLEKMVNIALVSLIVQTFYQRTRPLDEIVSTLSDNKITDEDAEEMVKKKLSDFYKYSDNVCQISQLTIQSSSNEKRIQHIRPCIERLEHIDPEISAAAMTCLRNRHDDSARDHLLLLQQEWCIEFNDLLKQLDEMTDPRVFLQVSEEYITIDCTNYRNALSPKDDETLTCLQRSIVDKTIRVEDLARLIYSQHDDPLFRSALLLHTDRLKKTTISFKESSQLRATMPNNKLVTHTLNKRLNQILEGIRNIRDFFNSSEIFLLIPSLEHDQSKPDTSSVDALLASFLDNDVGITDEVCTTDNITDKSRIHISESERLSDQNHSKTETDISFFENEDDYCEKYLDASEEESNGEFYSATEEDNQFASQQSRGSAEKHNMTADSFFGQETFEPSDFKTPKKYVKFPTIAKVPPVSFDTLCTDNIFVSILIQADSFRRNMRAIAYGEAPFNTESALSMLDLVDNLVHTSASMTTNLFMIAERCADSLYKKDLIFHSHRVSMAISQLDIIGKLLLSGIKNITVYETVIRSSSQLLDTMCNAVNIFEQLYLKCRSNFTSSEQPLAAISQLVNWKQQCDERLEDNRSSSLDQVGLQRLEMDNRRKITDHLFERLLST